MSDSIENLQKAITAAATLGKPFALDAKFLNTGLDDPEIVVPSDYDGWIQSAFFTEKAADFMITADVNSITPVEKNSFRVEKATVPFVGSNAPLESKATLVFALSGSNLVVQIQTSPKDWTWTDSFQFMDGYPFDQFAVLKETSFVFSTIDGHYPFSDDTGEETKGGPNQNFSTQIPLPTIVEPFLTLFDGLTAPSGDLVLSGALDMSSYNAETVLLPAGTLKAEIRGGTFDLLYLKVSDPSVTITIPVPDGMDEENGELADEDDDDAGDQAPLLLISSGIQVGSDEGKPPYSLQVQILEENGDDGNNSGRNYEIGLVATGEGKPLSPATIIELVGGGGNYLTATPDILQQFLSFVSLQGLSLSGPLSNPLDLTSVSVEIGSSPNTSWTILPDPTGSLDFTIKSFALQWSIQNPFDQKSRKQSYDFTTEFSLATSVFKGPGGEGDGIFTVQFTSDRQFYASFDGTAKLSDFLSTLTGGAVNLDSQSQGDFELSQIRLAVDYSAQSFSFASGFSLSLNFLEINGSPILSISEGQIDIAAKTPTQKDGKNSTALILGPRTGVADPNAKKNTVWQASIGGVFQVGPLRANARVAYDGFQTPARWNLHASLAEPFDVSGLINQFFDPGGSYPFPTFFPGDLKILSFVIDAVIPSGKEDGLGSSYDITTSFKWTFQLGEETVGIDPAKLGLSYDGSKPKGQQFSGFAEGTWIYTAINLKLTMGYRFMPTKDGGNSILFVEWEGFRAEWESGKEQITFSLKGWSIGTIIQALVRTLGNPYFTLGSPWDLLNQISLDGLRVIVSLKSGLSFSQRLSAEYVLSSPINLGFMNITGLTFRRDTSGKVTLAITGSSPLQNSDPAYKNLFDPAKGQDVQDLPSVPGRGEEGFKLFLLVLGQRIGITGFSEFKNTKEVICALENVPKTTGKSNPVDPNANQGGTKGLPYYDQGNSWIIAGHLGLLKVGKTWSIDAMVVFNDPNLYGLRLALAGEKVGGLANLVIDILYKKITDDIGVYQLEFTFPDAIRNLNFGTVSITLPQIGIKIFTNGDFFIDIGFPYNLDFRRSFSIAAIVYGVPVLGAGGFYFGKLSNATSTAIPQTDLGTFDPVIEFGLGLQLGLGYNFEKGPLKAGFALTVFGIIEGVVAPWHPYDGETTEVARVSGGGALQSDYYFKLTGTAGIIGLLYGSIDFAIISASINVKIVLSVQIQYESYREIPIIATATVDISVKVKINLGIFSISITLSFSARVSATFKLGENRTAPWEADRGVAIESLFAPLPIVEGPDAAVLRGRAICPRPKRLNTARLRKQGQARVDEKTRLSLMAAPQFTVLAPEGSTNPGNNEGAFVFLLVMDAPDPTGQQSTSDTSFEQLSGSYFPWIIDTLSNGDGDEVDLAEVMISTVTRLDLETWITRLADNENKVLTITQLLQFLDDAFTLNIENPATAMTSGLKEKLEKGSVVFPPFDGLSLSVPDPDGEGSSKPIDLEKYATATPAYARKISELFAEVAAQIEVQNQQNSASALNLDETAESMAALVFVDTFSMIARQLLQAAHDALKSYAFPLQSTTTIQGILDELNAVGTNDLGVGDVATPNAEHALSAALPIQIPSLAYVVQSDDTLDSIANRYSDDTSPPRWTISAEQLISTNRRRHLLQGGVALELVGKDGKSVHYETQTGDSFDEIAASLEIPLETLARQTVLYTVKGLLNPTDPMDIPPIAYTTEGTSGASKDTLKSVAAAFKTTVIDLASANPDTADLFSPQAENGLLTLANLEALSVGALWDAIAATDQVSQTAGMVSRFLMYGLRLPVEDGLTLSPEFLYSKQDSFGVYQLVGQQFPVPKATNNYSIDLKRAAQSHGVSLDFIEFNQTAGTSVSIDLAKAYESLGWVLEWAQQPGNFEPSPELEVLSMTERSPRAFTVSGFAKWSSSSVTSLQKLTNRNGTNDAEPDGQAQVQPTLWALPPAMTNLVATRQASIEGATQSVRSSLPLLPQFAPQVGRSNPATGQTESTDLDNWAWCTRVDFEIKRIPDATLIASDGSGAGDVPPGPASAPSLPFIYEVVGPTSEDAIKLERILSAMDDLGEDIVSGLFLLYNQNGPGEPMLVTPGEQGFLSFLTQTNLSTETNPVRSLMLALAQEETPPRGIANSPGEFVKLMWELSVVRSGGYYLYYERVESGDGLPAAIFDSSGSGTLSMVLTFAASGEHSFSNTVPGFVNAFVTTDELDTSRDVVQTVSLAASATSAPLQGSESLADLSAIYGPGPGRVAEVNGDEILTEGFEIPIAGVAHQLISSDLVFTDGNLDSGKTLDRLASHFSAGATSVISGADIAGFNPGVTVRLAAVFYIPTVTYKVSSSAAPGNRFSTMATYYRVSIDKIASCALGISGVFPANATVNIATQLFELRDQLPPRNLGISMQRVNLGEPPQLPPSPTPEEKADYAKTTMFSLYTSLSAGLAANAFYNDSPMGLPFGPQDHKQDEEPGEFESTVQTLERRKRRLTELAENDFDYRQSLGIKDRFAKVNAAPTPAVAGLPPKSENPYIGVGTTAQIALRWLDLFGNTTVTPFSAPPSGYRGALNGTAAPVLFSDRLIGLREWPNVKASYLYSDKAAPKLNLDFALDTSAYQGQQGKEQAAHDLKLYQRTYFQLHQDYTNNPTVKVPGISGNAVSMTVRNSLLAKPTTELHEDDAAAIRGFVSDCVVYLDHLVNGGELTAPVASVHLPVDVGQLTPGNILELDVELEFKRNPLLTEPSVAALQGGLTVRSAILPHADSDAGVAFTKFATALEEVVQTEDWYLKVGEGLSRTSEDSADGDQQLWVVRFGKKAGHGIYFEIGDRPSYYAPKPVAKALENGKARILNYQTGEGETVNFDGVDLNLWFQTTLDALDTFLSASYAPHAFILDKLDGIDDPLEDGLLGSVLSTKQTLADTISSTVLPVLSSSASDESTRVAAAEKFRQQLLNQIGAAYRSGTTTVFGLRNVSGGGNNDPVGPPNLYGQPSGVVQGQPINENYSLTSARIPLGPIPDNEKTYEPRLAFVLTSKNMIEQAYVPLDLDLKISHLEFDRRKVSGIDGYVESRWLAFVNGPFSYRLGDETANVPVVNRNLPTPPTISSQTAEKTPPSSVSASGGKLSASPSKPSQLNKWNYSFDYLYPQAASDGVSYTIELNRIKNPSPTNFTETDEPSLFETLAQFVSSYPNILRDFDQSLVKIDAQEPDPAAIATARKAVQAFATQTAAVASAYAESLKPTSGDVATQPQLVIVDFLSTLDRTEEGRARTNILHLEIDKKKATWDENTNTISNGETTVPAMVIAIDPDKYTPEAVPAEQLPSGVELAYLYETPAPQEKAEKPEDEEKLYLDFDQAQRISARTVSIDALDVLAYQSAWASIFVERNLVLFPIGGLESLSTNKAFLFRTPEVRFADPIVPRLVYESFSLDEMPGASGDLEQLLTSFFGGLFSGGSGSPEVEVSMQGTYSYRLSDSPAEIPRVVVPVNLLTPAPSSVNPQVAPGFVRPFAKVVEDWRKKNQPTVTGDAQVDIELKVYGATAAKQPLLTVSRLEHAVSKES